MPGVPFWQRLSTRIVLALLLPTVLSIGGMSLLIDRLFMQVARQSTEYTLESQARMLAEVVSPNWRGMDSLPSAPDEADWLGAAAPHHDHCTRWSRARRLAGRSGEHG